MKILKFIVPKVAIACAIVLFAGLNAQALTISDSDSFTGQITELTGTPLRVDQFDSASGTLTHVLVTLSGLLTSSGTVTNNAAGPQDFLLETLAKLFVGDLASGGPAALGDPYALAAPFTTINSESYTGLASGASDSFGPGTLDTGVLTVLDSSAASDLAQFTGTGDFGYNFRTTITTSFTGGGGNIGSTIVTLAGVTLNVEYTYEPTPPDPPAVVPEPATVVLLGVGLIGLAAISRKRMSK